MSKRPHLILITTDQHRSDCLGCDGHPVLQTPYLDDLARQGTRFSQAYSSVPACTPARAAIMTGMDQWNHGRIAMTGADALEYPATLPGELTRAGYHTRAVGKMHFHPQRRLYGFHHMVLDESSRREGNFISDYDRWYAGQPDAPFDKRPYGASWNSWLARPTHLPEHLHPTYWTASEGMHAVDTRDPSKPLFLWLSFARPHSPYDAPEPYFRMYLEHPDLPMPAVGDWAQPFDRRNDDVDAKYGRRSDLEVRRARAGYLGNITFIDHQLGRFFTYLRKHHREVLDDALILFTSDHGDMQGDHHHWRKGVPYQGAVRIPFILRYPNGVFAPRPDIGDPNPLMDRPPEAMTHDRGAAAVCDRPVELRDVMPTFLRAAGAPVPESVDGVDLKPFAAGQDIPERRWVHGEHSTGFQYLTDGKQKYVWFHFTGIEQLFDLTNDPLECRDLAALPESRPTLAKWRETLAHILESRGDARGRGGELHVVCDGMAGELPNHRGAITLTPNYLKWKQRAQALNA